MQEEIRSLKGFWPNSAKFCQDRILPNPAVCKGERTEDSGFLQNRKAEPDSVPDKGESVVFRRGGSGGSGPGSDQSRIPEMRRYGD